MKKALAKFCKWLINLFRKKAHETVDEIADKANEEFQKHVDQTLTDVVGKEEELEEY